METITFMTSLLTFYLKGEIKAEQNFLRLKKPNTLLTFIPLGAKKHNVPINQIADVSTSFKLVLKSFLLGAVEAIVGFAMFGNSFFAGLLLLLLGAFTIINSFQTELNIRTRGWILIVETCHVPKLIIDIIGSFLSGVVIMLYPLLGFSGEIVCRRNLAWLRRLW